MSMFSWLKKVLVLLISFLVLAQVYGQVILKRQVISSFGSSTSPSGSYYISHTLGQAGPVGTLFNGNFLRQGFEQPIGANNCGLLNNFVVEERTTECGTFYSFEFTGTARNDISYSWDFGDHAIPSESNNINPTDIVYTKDSIRSIIRLTITTEDGCMNTSAKFINAVAGGFSSRIFAEDVECTDEVHQLSVEPIAGTAPFEIEWSDGGIDLLRELGDGLYSYTLTDAFNCATVDSIDLQGLNSILELDGMTSPAGCDAAQFGSIDLTVIGGVPPFAFNWSVGATTEDLINLLPGSYSVEVTDARNCSSAATFEVGTDCLDKNNIPNMITPNGDQNNDIWVVPGIENFPNNELEIYNRWGSPIIDFAPYTNNWSGTNEDGSDLPMGAYYYVLQLHDANETTYSGSITIIR